MGDGEMATGGGPLKAWVKSRPALAGAARACLGFLRLLARPRLALDTLRYRLTLGRCGRGVGFETGMVVRNPGRISIGDRCTFSSFVVLDAHDDITIGNDCLFALRVTVSTATHDLARDPMNSATVTKPVVIGNNVWFGVGATVLPGITIGDGAVVGAHALVTKDVPPRAIVVGVPARILRSRGPEGGGGDAS